MVSVLEAPEKTYAGKAAGGKSGAGKPAGKPAASRRVDTAPALRRGLSDDYAEQEAMARVRRSHFGGIRFRLKGGVPRSITGRVIAGLLAFC